MAVNRGARLIRVLLAAGTLLLAKDCLSSTLEIEIVSPSGKPLADVVVVAHTAEPELVAEPVQARIDQKNLAFIPGVLVVQSGTEVSFPNRDDVMHHVYSFSPVKTFELPLYQSEIPPPVKFDRPGVAVVGCNIHDHMLAHVLAVDTPYFGTTDGAGRVVLELDPARVVSLTAWHPSWGEIGGERRTFRREKEIRWKVGHASAGRSRQGALAWNEDY